MEDFLDTLSALSNDTRVMLVAFLLTHGKSCVCEFEKSLNMTQSRLSINLNILKKSGFLSVTRDGKWAFYELNPKTSLHEKLIGEVKALKLKVPKKVCICDIKD